MTTHTTHEPTTPAVPLPGGFAGDPAEAFTPPAAGGCCGSEPATVASSAARTGPVPAVLADPAASASLTTPAASTCCGSAEAARSAGACCDPVAKTEAMAAGAGCCG